jgi:hypothetical protein
MRVRLWSGTGRPAISNNRHLETVKTMALFAFRQEVQQTGGDKEETPPSLALEYSNFARQIMTKYGPRHHFGL